jgi:hypothetical protein
MILGSKDITFFQNDLPQTLKYAPDKKYRPSLSLQLLFEIFFDAVYI